MGVDAWPLLGSGHVAMVGLGCGQGPRPVGKSAHGCGWSGLQGKAPTAECFQHKNKHSINSFLLMKIFWLLWTPKAILIKMCLSLVIIHVVKC